MTFGIQIILRHSAALVSGNQHSVFWNGKVKNDFYLISALPTQPANEEVHALHQSLVKEFKTLVFPSDIKMQVIVS